MTYEQALAFWFGRVNFEQRTLRLKDLNLDRMRDVLELLGNPHQKLCVVHVAGSKGKGSTSAMLACVLQHAGLRTGLFTSPHLTEYRERIQIDGRLIEPAEVTELMADIAVAVEQLDRRKEPDSPGVTFFEIATALGFLFFERRQVDIAVLEVGLGGRFDATNVCQPAVSVITSISFDHVQQLGNTLARIAMEKAGIIKPGRPVISGAVAPEAQTVIESISAERHAPLRQLNKDFFYTYEPGEMATAEERWPVVHVRTEKRSWSAMRLKLLGEHQAANAALVVAAVEELVTQGWRIPSDAVAAGLADVHWPARLEIIRRQPLVILDCAHNLASAEVLLDTLKTTFAVAKGNANGSRRAALIFGGSNDKDLAGMLRILAPFFQHIYLTRYGNNPRCVPPEQLALAVEASGVPCSLCATAPEAWQKASSAATAADLICITGSVFLAGELRPFLLSP